MYTEKSPPEAQIVHRNSHPHWHVNLHGGGYLSIDKTVWPRLLALISLNMNLKYILPLVFIFSLFHISTAFAQGGRITSDPIAINGAGRPVAGANVSICAPLATSGAVGNGSLITFTMASNPQTAGFAAGGLLQVEGFTGGDAVFNAGTLLGPGYQIVGGYTVLAVSSSSITVAGTVNRTASTNGTVLQEGNSTTPCGGLVQLYTDASLTVTSNNPFITDGLGNYGAGIASGTYYTQIYGPGVTTALRQFVVGTGSGGSSVNVTVSSPLVSSPNPFTGTATLSCPSCTFAPGGISQYQIPYGGSTTNSLVGITPGSGTGISFGATNAGLPVSLCLDYSLACFWGLSNATAMNFGSLGATTGHDYLEVGGAVGLGLDEVAGVWQVCFICTGSGGFTFSSGNMILNGPTSGSFNASVPAAGSGNPFYWWTAMGTTGQFLTTDGNNPAHLSWASASTSTTIVSPLVNSVVVLTPATVGTHWTDKLVTANSTSQCASGCTIQIPDSVADNGSATTPTLSANVNLQFTGSATFTSCVINPGTNSHIDFGSATLQLSGTNCIGLNQTNFVLLQYAQNYTVTGGTIDCNGQPGAIGLSMTTGRTHAIYNWTNVKNCTDTASSAYYYDGPQFVTANYIQGYNNYVCIKMYAQNSGGGGNSNSFFGGGCYNSTVGVIGASSNTTGDPVDGDYFYNFQLLSNSVSAFAWFGPSSVGPANVWFDGSQPEVNASGASSVVIDSLYTVKRASFYMNLTHFTWDNGDIQEASASPIIQADNASIINLTHLAGGPSTSNLVSNDGTSVVNFDGESSAFGIVAGVSTYPTTWTINPYLLYSYMSGAPVSEQDVTIPNYYTGNALTPAFTSTTGTTSNVTATDPQYGLVNTVTYASSAGSSSSNFISFGNVLNAAHAYNNDFITSTLLMSNQTCSFVFGSAASGGLQPTITLVAGQWTRVVTMVQNYGSNVSYVLIGFPNCTTGPTVSYTQMETLALPHATLNQQGYLAKVLNKGAFNPNGQAIATLLPTATRIGDILYCSAFVTSSCSTWSLLPGNNSGTQYLQESSGGVPSWVTSSGAAFSALSPGINSTAGSFGFSGNTFNNSAAAHTFPVIVASTSGGLPATCTVGEVAYVSGATAGQNLYFCNSTNVWTQQLNSGTGSASTALGNLAAVAINTTLLPASVNTVALGSTSLPFTNVFLGVAGGDSFSFGNLGNLTANRNAFVPDANSALFTNCPAVANKVVTAMLIATGNCTQANLPASATMPFAYAADSGSATAYVVTLSPAITAYAVGVEVDFLPANANSGAAPTLNVNSVGADPITKFGGTALVANDLVTTAIAKVIWDGTDWELQNPNTVAVAVTSSSTNTLTNKTLNAESTGNNLSIPAKAFFPAAGCSGGSTAGPSLVTGSTNAPNPQCAGTTVPKGVLQFARGNVAYISSFQLPSDWNSGASTDIQICFTTTDTTSGHVTSFNIQTGFNSVTGAATDDPSLNGSQALSVTTGASQTSGGELCGSLTSMTMTGSGAGYNFEVAITRNNSGTDTNTDSAVAMKYATITLGRTMNASNR